MNGATQSGVCVLLFASTATLMLTGGFAAAQNMTNANANDYNGIQTIVVTAQKHEDRINDVPLSITAATGAQLLKQGITSPADLEKIVPGFTYQPSTYSTPVFTIRGIGFYDISLAAPPAVSVYIDQVPLPYSQMAQGASLDLERVEALKGPQGTLFGQNATGGAINYIAAKPTQDFHTGVNADYGRFNSGDFEGFISGPLAPTLRARFAFRTEQSGDWQKSQTRDASLGQRDFTTGRLLLDWEPSDRVKFEFNANGWRDLSDTQAAQFISYSPENPTGLQTNVHALSIFPAPPRNDRAADWDPNFRLHHDDTFYQLSLRGDMHLSDALKLTSITSYSNLKVNIPTNTDGTPYGNFFLTLHGRIETVTQELRLSGNVDRLKWVFGGNYEHDDTTDDQDAHSVSTGSNFGPYVWTDVINANHQVINTGAVFGSADYNLTQQLTLQGSVRYTRASDDFTGCLRDDGDGLLSAGIGALASLAAGRPITIPPGACVTFQSDGTPVPIVRKSLVQDNVSWRAGLSWQPQTDTLLYANVTKGYKAGTFSTVPGLEPAQFNPAPQESVLAYETGFKRTLAQHTLQLDGALFYYRYDDKQILGYINTGAPFGNLPGLVSIPRSSVRGAELSVIWQPIRSLKFSGGATYVNSRVDSSFLTPDPFGALVDVRGESFPNTPSWQLVSDVEYDFGLSGDLSGYVGIGGRYRSHSVAAFGGSSEFQIPAYGVLDLRAGIESGRWRFGIWGRNVTNTFYVTQVSHVTDTVASLTGMPATYGLNISFHY